MKRLFASGKKIKRLLTLSGGGRQQLTNREEAELRPSAFWRTLGTWRLERAELQLTN